MGNRIATIAIYYNENRTLLDIGVNGNINYELTDNTIIYKIPPEFGIFEAMRFIPTQDPISIGSLTFVVIAIRQSSRTVTCAFVNQSKIPQSFSSIGMYANGRDPYSGKFIIQGITTITFNNPVQYDGNNALVTFDYYLPTVRTYDATNSTIDNGGIIRYNTQIVDPYNTRLIAMDYISLKDMSNANGQYNLDIDLIKDDNGNITLSYHNDYCPNVTNVSYTSDLITITSNVPIPKISLICKLSRASLGIPNNLNFYLDMIDDYNTLISIVNNNVNNILKVGASMTLSLLILPLSP